MAVGCAKIDNIGATFTLEKPYTYPEERNVLQAVPIEPVYQESL